MSFELSSGAFKDKLHLYIKTHIPPHLGATQNFFTKKMCPFLAYHTATHYLYFFILFSPAGYPHPAGMIPDGPICARAGAGGPFGAIATWLGLGGWKLPAESSLLPAISAVQLEYFSPWDGFAHKINVLSELILFLKGESHHIVKTDHKKMHQSVGDPGYSECLFSRNSASPHPPAQPPSPRHLACEAGLLLAPAPRRQLLLNAHGLCSLRGPALLLRPAGAHRLAH